MNFDDFEELSKISIYAVGGTLILITVLSAISNANPS